MPNISVMLPSFWEKDVKIPNKEQMGIYFLQSFDCLIQFLEFKCDVLNFLPRENLTKESDFQSLTHLQ